MCSRPMVHWSLTTCALLMLPSTSASATQTHDQCRRLPYNWFLLVSSFYIVLLALRRFLLLKIVAGLDTFSGMNIRYTRFEEAVMEVKMLFFAVRQIGVGPVFSAACMDNGYQILQNVAIRLMRWPCGVFISWIWMLLRAADQSVTDVCSLMFVSVVCVDNTTLSGGINVLQYIHIQWSLEFEYYNNTRVKDP